MAAEPKPAQYFHASIYRFEEEARKAVIERFRTTVDDISARCWYDPELHMFFVKCPTAVGQNIANQALGDAMSRYIASELAAAEREDRLPVIRLFDDDVSGEPEDSAADALTEPMSYINRYPAPKEHQPLIFHLIAEETPLNTLLKFFKPEDIGEIMFSKILTTRDDRSRITIKTSSTCRVARFRPKEKDYVFNGRTGSPAAILDTISDHDIFRSTNFVSINNGKNDVEEQASAVDVQHWRFVGEKPTLGQWLDGMGKVELVDPEVGSEAPKDAKRFQKKPITQTSSLGRMRVPKGATEAVQLLKLDQSDSEDETGGRPKRFDQLLNGNNKAGADTDSDSESSESDDEPLKAFLEQSNGKGSKNGLVSTASASADTRSTARAAESTAVTPTRPTSNAPKHSSSPIVPPDEQKWDPDHQQKNENFPEHSRFAKVDQVGLTSNAANQAAWEHAHPEPRRKKANKSGIGWRALTNSSSEDAISQSTAPRPPPSQTTNTSSYLQVPAESESTGYAKTKADTMPWANRVNRPTSTAKNLVDDTVVQGPPYVKPSSGSSVHGNDYNDVHQSPQSSEGKDSRVTRKAPFDSHAETQDLIDVSEDKAAYTNVRVKLPTMHVLSPSTPSNATSRQNALQENDDPIIERCLQRPADVANKKQNTMRQKAGKKGKASKSTSKGQTTPHPAVNLPKPDPPPLPLKKAPKAQQDTSKLTVQSSKASDTSYSERARSASNVTSEDEEHKDSSILELHGLQKVVQKLSNGQNLGGAEIKIEFGLLLSRHINDKNFIGAVHEPESMQTRIQNASSDILTNLFPRLTTSENDARFLFRSRDGESESVHADVRYEIQLRTSNGEVRLVHFKQATTNEFVVSKPNNVLAEAYMHYPLRVWDAKCTVFKAQVDQDLNEAVGDFIGSIQTIGQAPSFLATLLSHQFTIEKIYAKRIFSKIAKDVEMRLAEVQDLKLSPVNSKGFNFGATADAPSVMIQNEKMWWECCLHAKAVDLETSGEMQRTADDIVSKMDDIGFGNRGPVGKIEIEDPKQSAQSEIWTLAEVGGKLQHW